ncbi:DUF1829 domain-containing protein [Cytobacillus sp. S13-E01]|uniref:DUF1829 domain-containing protein n=1 Tax=Cytobacillus sp. S13-E01 TaxID=3031326 RepID=UPI0023D7D950|nr:DUF1829 domain-containing protein [Cytobacillus sp. S13-E01]MDF0728252.1 DUF1829 domain-containing protein [Cytobacillus sp. S13-E01]
MALDTIKDSYLNWIKNNTTFTEVLNNSVELSSPYVDSLNENIKLYIEPSQSKFKITDDGYTLWSLETAGTAIRKGSYREKMLYNVIDRHCISINPSTNELFIYSDKDSLGSSIHSLIQATLTISDFLKLNKKSIKNLFMEEVSKFFSENEEIFDPFPDIEIQGKSKLLHRFDYLMTVKNKHKKLVKLVNHLDQVQLERILLSWQDTSQQRTTKYKENLGMVALINDSQKPIASKFEEAFLQYGIEAIGFTNKTEVKRSLSLVG